MIRNNNKKILLFFKVLGEFYKFEFFYSTSIFQLTAYA